MNKLADGRVGGFLILFAALLGAACTEFFAPAANDFINLRLAVRFASGGAPEAFDRADRVRIFVVTTAGIPVLDTILPFQPSSETRVRAAINSNEGENAIVRTALLRGPTPLFAGSAVTVIGDAEPIDITLLAVATHIGAPPTLAVTGAIGDTVRSSAVALFGTGDTIRNAVLSWRSDNAAVVQAAGAALIMNGDGSTRVIAEAAGLSSDLAGFLGLTPAQASIQVQVTIEAAAIVVTPNPATVNSGQTLALTAVVRDRRGNLIPRQPAWSSANPSIATVSANGVVSGLAAGQTTISARSGSVNTAVPLTVRSAGLVVGRVVNAVDARGIPGATVIARIGAPPVATTTTDANGDYTLGVDAGTYQIVASSSGYISSAATVTISTGQTVTENFALSPVLPAGQYRIVLTWGAAPQDLDAHLSVPTPNGLVEVYWNNLGSANTSPFALLDVDDMDGFGPETITIHQQFQGQYSFWVENYSAESNISDSEAVVRVFSGASMIAEFAPPALPGLRWDVFTLNGSTLTPIQRISNTVPQSSLGRPSGSGIGSKTGQGTVAKRLTPAGRGADPR